MEEKDLKEIKKVVTESVKGLPTKSDVAEAVKGLASKSDVTEAVRGLASKSDVAEAVEAGNENLAILINTAFQEQKDHLDQKFEAVDQRFEEVGEEIREVKDTLHVVEAKVNKALNIEYARLEKRLKFVEQKLGITATAENSN